MQFSVSGMVLSVVAALAAAVLPAAGESRAAPESKVCKNAAGVAAGGYDVVSYFTAGRPERGDARFAVKRNGAEYRFASERHRAQFAANPEAYLPQYGGHCAYALSKGKTVDGDPTAWVIRKGKLYFAVSREALGLLESGLNEAIEQADAFWRQLY